LSFWFQLEPIRPGGTIWLFLTPRSGFFEDGYNLREPLLQLRFLRRFWFIDETGLKAEWYGVSITLPLNLMDRLYSLLVIPGVLRF